MPLAWTKNATTVKQVSRVGPGPVANASRWKNWIQIGWKIRERTYVVRTSSTKAKLVQSLMKLQSICVQPCNFFTSKICPEPASLHRYGSSLQSWHDNGFQQYRLRAVASRGQGGSSPPPVFDRSVNPISTRGSHSPHPVLPAHLDFQTLRRPCRLEYKSRSLNFPSN